MSGLEQRLRELFAEQAGARELRHVTFRKRAGFGWVPSALVAAGTFFVLLLLASGVVALRSWLEGPRPVGAPPPTVIVTPSPPAASTQPPASQDFEKIGIADRPACAVAAAPPLILATFGIGADVSFRCVLHLSRDDGRTWRAQLETENVRAVAVDVRTKSIFAGTTNGRIWRGDFEGRWRLVYETPPGTFQPVVERFAFHNEQIFAAVRGVLVSKDGETWRDITAGLGTFDSDISRRGRFSIVGMTGFAKDLLIAINANLPEVGLWATDGLTWRRLGLSPGSGLPAALATNARVVVLAVDRAGDRQASAAWVSRDAGSSWLRATRGAENVELFALDASPAGIFAGASEGVLTLDEQDLSWKPIATHKPKFVRGLRTSTGRLYVAAWDGLWLYPLSR